MLPEKASFSVYVFCISGYGHDSRYGRLVDPAVGLRQTALVQRMVRRLTAREKLREEKVCVHVSGLSVKKISWP